jgi:glycosyltransferase involved in cell wall biosynthesis
MDAKGYEIEIVALGPPDPDWPENWPLTILPSDFPGTPSRMVWRLANITGGHDWVPAGSWLWGAVKIRKLLQNIQPDIVHVHFIDHLPISALLTGFHPIVATSWGSDLLRLPKTYTAPQQMLLRRALAAADLISCNSLSLREATISYGVDPSKIIIRHWGIDLTKFRPGLNITAMHENLGIEEDALVLLSPRKIQFPFYSIEGVIQAFHQILQHYPQAVLIQLGCDTNPEALHELKSLAKRLGIFQQIRWVNFVSEEDLPILFNLSKITISLSISDSLPTSLLEAMACGSIPIFSNVGSIKDWIEHAKNGMLVQPGESKSLANAILTVLDQGKDWWDYARAKNLDIIRNQANRERELDAAANDYLSLLNHSHT